MSEDNHLVKHLNSAAFAYRGYDIANLGRTPELLAHAMYGPVMAKHLADASELASDILGHKVNLVTRVREQKETVGLDTYGEDVALIIAVGVAQIRLLDEFFGISTTRAQLAFGYSLGEITALIACGVYPMQDLLGVLLHLADDAVILARDVSLGVLFSRGAALDAAAVQRLCIEISRQGEGLIDVSAFLSPNSLLLLGQNDTLQAFHDAKSRALPGPVHLRKKPHRWPPMHTIITRQRSLADRSGMLLATAAGGTSAPTPRLISGVTGKASYNDYNSRELLHRWTDHPQQLWSMVHETLTSGVETVVHVGPAPNIIPATFKRISDDVKGQMNGFSPSQLGLKAISQLARRPWLAQLLPSTTALLRAPYLQHIILEDWLLTQGAGAQLKPKGEKLNSHGR